MPPSLTARRLRAHGISAPVAASPADAVRHMTAMQAQDYHASLWAVGLRTKGSSLAQVEDAIARGEIVRTWPMRGTLHLLAREDVRWMVALLAPRVQAANAGRIARELGLDAATLARGQRVVEKALAAGVPVLRSDLYARMDAAGIASASQRGLHLLNWLAHESVICHGPRHGKQPTFVLMDAWVPPSAALDRDEALHRLALRYLQGHGPATAADLAWWSGLTQKDARLALTLASSTLEQETHDDTTWWWRSDAPAPSRSRAVHLLPAFDEYLIGYRDRTPVLDTAQTRRVFSVNGLVAPTMIVGGRVAATWKRGSAVDDDVVLDPFRVLDDAERAGIQRAVQHWRRFLGDPH
ncbi:MAG: winged helix DNA-binding domain-containing protein [Stenotrophomonas acidaminiphila]|nr:MAG: winged helix DNA-binding domain-containing protein [Stenotrophomonas acidaminiphila]